MSGLGDTARAAVGTAAVAWGSLAGGAQLSEQSQVGHTSESQTSSEVVEVDDAPSATDQYLSDHPALGLGVAAGQLTETLVGGSKERDDVADETEAVPEAEYADVSPPGKDSTFAAVRDAEQAPDADDGQTAGDGTGEDTDEGPADGDWGLDDGWDAETGIADGSDTSGDVGDVDGGDIGQ